MTILILDMCFERNSIYRNEFVKPVTDILQKNNIKFKVEYFLSIKQKDLTNISKIILCGVALKDYFAWKKTNKLRWILNFNKPVLGICMGGQVIAKLFGAKLIKDLQIGVFRTTVLLEDKLSDIIRDKEAYTMHNYNIKSPKNFQVLAKIKNSPILFKHKQKPTYLAMFHPEVLNKEFIEEFTRL